MEKFSPTLFFGYDAIRVKLYRFMSHLKLLPRENMCVSLMNFLKISFGLIFKFSINILQHIVRFKKNFLKRKKLSKNISKNDLFIANKTTFIDAFENYSILIVNISN